MSEEAAKSISRLEAAETVKEVSAQTGRNGLGPSKHRKLGSSGKLESAECTRDKTDDDSPVRKRPATEDQDKKKCDEKESHPSSLSPSNHVQKETNEASLPDPTVKVSPDVYLMQLVKATLGVEFEVKGALSLKSFFSEVTEEQMASYTMDVVGAARNNDLEAIKKLQSEGQPLNCFNRFGESLLNMACRRGFEQIVEYLLQQPNVELRVCDDGGRTPLHDACWNPSPQLNICKWILERDPSLFFIADRRGCTAFQYARPEHWGTWRKFLFENRSWLESLKAPETREQFAKKS